MEDDTYANHIDSSNGDSYAYLEEAEFENEYNVYERVGVNMIEMGTSQVEVDLRDPIQRFTTFTKTVAQEMISQGVIALKRPDILYIVDQIKSISNAQYKNPTAFVLGFWVTTREGTINQERLNNIIPLLKSLKYPVQNYDVIRYANLWINTGLYYTG